MILIQLKHIVTNPSRRNNILDKIYTNMDMLYRLPVVMPPLGSSDHHVVTCEPTVSFQFSTGNKVVVNTRVMGPNERVMFSMELRNLNWFAMYNMVSYNEQFAFFKETLNSLLDKHFHPNQWSATVVTSHGLMILSALLWGDDRGHTCRVILRVITDTEIRSIAWLNLSKLNTIIIKLPPLSMLTLHVGGEKSELTSSMPSRGVSSLQHMADHVCGGDLSRLAEDINEFFVSLCHDMPPLTDVNNYSMLECESVPAKYVMSVENVENQLYRLNTKKATEPDNIPTWVLRDFCQVLAGPVACLWNSSIREGTISNVWKSAYVSLLPKVTPALEVRKDLRPLLSKGLESHVVKWLWEIIFDKIDTKQFGSVKGYSTVHALVELLHTCYSSTDASRNFVRILLLDYSKAFDLINHQIVLQNCLIWEPQHSCLVGLRPS